MVEYIDREAANLALAEQGFDWDKAKQALASVPAADVVPVVRCKDCKCAYINSFSVASGVVFCSSNMKAMQEDDFCSYGERMDGGVEDEV